MSPRHRYTLFKFYIHIITSILNVEVIILNKLKQVNVVVYLAGKDLIVLLRVPIIHGAYRAVITAYVSTTEPVDRPMDSVDVLKVGWVLNATSVINAIINL